MPVGEGEGGKEGEEKRERKKRALGKDDNNTGREGRRRRE